MTTKVNNVDVQGAENVKEQETTWIGKQGFSIEDVTKPKEKKEQKVSISYTLKSFSENIRKLRDNKIVTKEEADKLEEIQKKAVQTWIGLEFGL